MAEDNWTKKLPSGGLKGGSGMSVYEKMHRAARQKAQENRPLPLREGVKELEKIRGARSPEHNAIKRALSEAGERLDLSGGKTGEKDLGEQYEKLVDAGDHEGARKFIESTGLADKAITGPDVRDDERAVLKQAMAHHEAPAKASTGMSSRDFNSKMQGIFETSKADTRERYEAHRKLAEEADAHAQKAEEAYRTSPSKETAEAHAEASRMSRAAHNEARQAANNIGNKSAALLHGKKQDAAETASGRMFSKLQKFEDAGGGEEAVKHLKPTADVLPQAKTQKLGERLKAQDTATLAKLQKAKTSAPSSKPSDKVKEIQKRSAQAKAKWSEAGREFNALFDGMQKARAAGDEEGARKLGERAMVAKQAREAAWQEHHAANTELVEVRKQEKEAKKAARSEDKQTGPLQTGARGGQYYVSESGEKVYVEKK